MRLAPVVSFPIVVYGVVHDSLVFMKRGEALGLATLLDALGASKTWRDLRRNLPPVEYRAILERVGEHKDGPPHFGAFYRQLVKERGEVSREEARQMYDALPLGQRMPSDDDPFDASQIYGFCDGDWPWWPAQEMLKWVPQTIQQLYGNGIDSTLNGPFLEFSPGKEKVIVRRFRLERYRCVKDQALVDRAHGIRP